METKRILERLKTELGSWQTRLDELRVQANLGGKELRDRRDQVLREFDEAYREARTRFDDARKTASGEVQHLRSSVEAGWEQARKTYEQLSKSSGEDERG